MIQRCREPRRYFLIPLFKYFFGVLLGIGIMSSVIDFKQLVHISDLPKWIMFCGIPLFSISLLAIFQVRKKDILVNHNGIELLLPKQYQIPKDRYRKGDTIRAVVAEVRRDNGNPTVVISRTSPVFLEQLFENEIIKFEIRLIN